MHNAQRVGGVGRVKRNPLAQFLLTGCLQQAIQDIKNKSLPACLNAVQTFNDQEQ